MTCAHCGGPLQPARLKPRYYCSSRCSQAGYKAGKRFGTKATIPERAETTMATPTAVIRQRVARTVYGLARGTDRLSVAIGISGLAKQAGVDPDAILAILRGEPVRCAVLADVLWASGSTRAASMAEEEAV